MKKIFVSHPYGGKCQNMRAITHICQHLVCFGIMPISPVLAFSFMNDHVEEERSKALEWCDSLIEVVDEVWFFGEWWNSEGCQLEMIKAAKGKQTIRIIEGWSNNTPVFRGGDEPDWWQS